MLIPEEEWVRKVTSPQLDYLPQSRLIYITISWIIKRRRNNRKRLKRQFLTSIIIPYPLLSSQNVFRYMGRLYPCYFKRLNHFFQFSPFESLVFNTRILERASSQSTKAPCKWRSPLMVSPNAFRPCRSLRLSNDISCPTNKFPNNI